MKVLITLAIIASLWYLGRAFIREVRENQARQDQAEGRPVKKPAGPAAPANPDAALAGLPENFEPSLADAQKSASTLKAWLDKYASFAQDPRLGAIQLDYVLLISRENPREAKQVYQEVKARTPPNSPIYERVKRLGKTYD